MTPTFRYGTSILTWHPVSDLAALSVGTVPLADVSLKDLPRLFICICKLNSASSIEDPVLVSQ
jgi:hypothetical protein